MRLRKTGKARCVKVQLCHYVGKWLIKTAKGMIRRRVSGLRNLPRPFTLATPQWRFCRFGQVMLSARCWGCGRGGVKLWRNYGKLLILQHNPRTVSLSQIVLPGVNAVCCMCSEQSDRRLVTEIAECGGGAVAWYLTE